MKITIEHLIPYLIHGLKVEINDNKYVMNSIYANVSHIGCLNNSKTTNVYDVKPILRPLSDLSEEITLSVGGKKYWGAGEFTETEWDLFKKSDLSISEILHPKHINELCKRHFDIFNLIPNELAHDMNSTEYIL